MTHKQRFTSNGKGSADSRTANRQALRDGLDRIFGKRELIPTPKRERIVYGSAKRDNPAQ